jgi:hypothetical protein
MDGKAHPLFALLLDSIGANVETPLHKDEGRRTKDDGRRGLFYRVLNMKLVAQGIHPDSSCQSDAEFPVSKVLAREQWSVLGHTQLGLTWVGLKSAEGSAAARTRLGENAEVDAVDSDGGVIRDASGSVAPG